MPRPQLALSLALLSWSAPDRAAADSFLTSTFVHVEDDRTPPGLANSRDALYHMDRLVNAGGGYQPRAADVRLVRRRLKDAPDDPLALLDSALVETLLWERGVAGARKGLARARRAASLLGEDPPGLLVAALVIAQADAFSPLGDPENWDRETPMKREAMELFRRACALNRARPAPGFAPTFASAVEYMRLYRGYRALTRRPPDCSAAGPIARSAASAPDPGAGEPRLARAARAADRPAVAAPPAAAVPRAGIAVAPAPAAAPRATAPPAAPAAATPPPAAAPEAVYTLDDFPWVLPAPGAAGVATGTHVFVARWDGRDAPPVRLTDLSGAPVETAVVATDIVPEGFEAAGATLVESAPIEPLRARTRHRVEPPGSRFTTGSHAMTPRLALEVGARVAADRGWRRGDVQFALALAGVPADEPRVLRAYLMGADGDLVPVAFARWMAGDRFTLALVAEAAGLARAANPGRPCFLVLASDLLGRTIGASEPACAAAPRTPSR